MTRHRAIVRAISIVAAVTFFWTNCVWGLSKEEYLAAGSQLREICEKFGSLNLNSAVLTPTQIRDLSSQGKKLEISEDYFLRIANIYNSLVQDNRVKLAGIFKEAIEYEKKEDGAPFPFKTWELFRMLYVLERLDIKDGQRAIESFLESLTRRGDKFVSYIDAFSYLDIDEHLQYAESLLKKEDRNNTDIELAQYHIGRVFGLLIEKYKNKAYAQSKFKEAMRILDSYNAVDKDENGKPYPIGMFARDLTRRDTVIRHYKERNPSDITVKAISLEQFDKFKRGTQDEVGDSVSFPTPGLRITYYDRSGNKVTKKYEELAEIGKGLIGKVAMSMHAGGKGERYDTIIYDARGKKLIANRAKGVYRLPIDNAVSFVEMMIRQVTGDNYKYKQNIPVVIYTSIFTDSEVKHELGRLGYSIDKGGVNYTVYKHENIYMPEVRVVYCSTTHNLDSNTGDFVSHERRGISREMAVWSDAHDSSFIDLIASGTAYELLVKQGKGYVTITNVDNRAGVLDPALIALMELTGRPLINELAEKPKGQKGGTVVKVLQGILDKYPSMKRIVIGNLVFLIEGFEFDERLWKELEEIAREEARRNGTKINEEVESLIKRYFPLFNTASYVVNIKEYVKQVFGVEDAKIDHFLKKFHTARNNLGESLQLRFKLLESAYKFRMQSFEAEKRYPGAQRPANLAGDQTRVVKTLMVEVPADKEGGKYSRFEPQKEQLRNSIRLRRFFEYLVSTNNGEMVLADVLKDLIKRIAPSIEDGLIGEILDMALGETEDFYRFLEGKAKGGILTDVQRDVIMVLAVKAIRESQHGDLVRDSAKVYRWDVKKIKDQKLSKIIEAINYGIEKISGTLKRMEEKEGRKYPKGIDGVEDVISTKLQGAINKAKGITDIPVDPNKVYFLDAKWRARAHREYNGDVVGEVEDLSRREELKDLLDWFESRGIYSIAVSGDIKDIVDEFFDVIIKVIEREGLDKLEEIINDLGIFNLYITQDDTGKRLVITSPAELRMVDAINGLVKLTGNTGLEDEVSAFIKTNPKAETHYIRLDVDRLNESSTLDYWKKMIEKLSSYKTTAETPLFQFVYFSSSGGVDVSEFLARHKLIGAIVPEKARVITILDPADIKDGAEMDKNTLYLPIPYMRGALSMAAEVVLSGGTVDRLTPIVRSAMVGLYKEVLGRDITDNDIKELFTIPWKFLPEIRRVIEDLETLRRSIQMTEMAA